MQRKSGQKPPYSLDKSPKRIKCHDQNGWSAKNSRGLFDGHFTGIKKMNQQLNKNGKKTNKRVIKDSLDLSADESIHHMEAENLNFCTFHGGRTDQEIFD